MILSFYRAFLFLRTLPTKLGLTHRQHGYLVNSLWQTSVSRVIQNIHHPIDTSILASAVLVSSNPTNLVLSGAFSISYFVYTAKIILPVLAAALLTLPVLLVQFRDPKYIPRKMKPITLSPRSALVDPFGGVFSSTLLVLTLCTLVATSTLHPQLYLVTVPPAVMVLTRDILYDLRSYPRRKKEREVAFNSARKTVPQTSESTEKEPNARGQVVATVNQREGATLIGIEVPNDGNDGTPLKAATKKTSEEGVSLEEQNPPLSQVKAVAASDADVIRLASSESRDPESNLFERVFPTVAAIVRIMPFSLVLFSFSLFILVQGLAVTGWVDVWAGWWGIWTDRTGPVGTVFGMGLVSCVLCNVSLVWSTYLLSDAT